MSQIFQQLLDEVGINRPSPATPIHLFPVKNRISMVGTVGAGKSTVVAGIVMTAEKLVAEDPNFYCRVIEGSSNIHQDVSNLRDGHFPKKTTAFESFATEAGLLMEWERKIAGINAGVKRLQVPLCDVAGEDLAQMIRQVRAAGALGDIAKQAVRNLIAYVRESDGFIITIKATRAKGLFPKGEQLETETDKKLSQDPDVNLVRLLEDLINYKMTHRSRPIKGVAVVITAWDRLKHSGVSDKIGFDILNPILGQNDLDKFVRACFPAVYAAVKSLRIPNVKYFPSFFETEIDENGDPKHWPGETNSPIIKARETQVGTPDEWWRDLRQISYNEKGNIDLINWLKPFAAM